MKRLFALFIVAALLAPSHLHAQSVQPDSLIPPCVPLPGDSIKVYGTELLPTPVVVTALERDRQLEQYVIEVGGQLRAVKYDVGCTFEEGGYLWFRLDTEGRKTEQPVIIIPHLEIPQFLPLSIKEV